MGSDGSVTAAPTIEIPKKALGEPVHVERARPGAVPKGQGTKVVATFVTDGDSFFFNGGSTPAYECRLDVVDTPETAKTKYNKPGQPYGEEATAYLKKMIENKEVDIHVTGKAKGYNGKEGRNICQVEINGKGVDLELVKAGMAWVYQRFVIPGSARAEELNNAEQEARNKKKGLWKDPNPEYPEQFRIRTNKH